MAQRRGPPLSKAELRAQADAAIAAATKPVTKLMGDVVEPRRDFIQENALAASVDV